MADEFMTAITHAGCAAKYDTMKEVGPAPASGAPAPEAPGLHERAAHFLQAGEHAVGGFHVQGREVLFQLSHRGRPGDGA